ncbi:hypothetical protein CLF_101753, partial [Clonorchis sinensis]
MAFAMRYRFCENMNVVSSFQTTNSNRLQDIYRPHSSVSLRMVIQTKLLEMELKYNVGGRSKLQWISLQHRRQSENEILSKKQRAKSNRRVGKLPELNLFQNNSLDRETYCDKFPLNPTVHPGHHNTSRMNSDSLLGHTRIACFSVNRPLACLTFHIYTSKRGSRTLCGAHKLFRLLEWSCGVLHL